MERAGSSGGICRGRSTRQGPVLSQSLLWVPPTNGVAVPEPESLTERLRVSLPAASRAAAGGGAQGAGGPAPGAPVS